MAVSIDNMPLAQVLSAAEVDGQFRNMTYADLKQVIAIEKSAYTHPWTTGIFRDCIRVGYSCWVYLRDSQIAGYGILLVATNEAHILNICVDPQYQSKGIGRIILRHLVAHCVLTEIDMAILEVRRSNAAAARLYQSEGFHELGVRKDYYPADGGREDAIIFAKYITPRKQ